MLRDNYKSIQMKPKIFLLDGLGALISIIFLGVLYFYENFFGMPKEIVKIFIVIALCLMTFSLSVYLFNPKNWRSLLKVVITLNLSYCLYTLYHVFQNRKELTIYGLLYFMGEILVIILICWLEVRVVKKG
jgi:peptidoglycan/LPS O-acetylase OafA/YrhL